jgi:predicted RNase H-like HicB family nuclease
MDMVSDGLAPGLPKPAGSHLMQRLTAIIEREGDGYVALCPELDIASQGDSVESARQSLSDAVDLFFECASAEEVARRLSSEVYITHIEIPIG